MKNLFKHLILSTIITASYVNITFAKEVAIDRVAVIVNDGVVLESEVTNLMASVKQQAKNNNQTLPTDKTLRIQILEKLINDSIILQLGERMGIQVSDTHLEQTISNMAKENNLSIEDFRHSIINSGENFAAFRENIRKEIILGEVTRNSLRRRIYISPQEIQNLLALMKEQSNANVEYRLGHILIEFPTDPKQADITAAKKRAEKVIALLNEGSDFTRIAMTSSGGANALEGGDLGWKTINEMPTLFSKVVEGKNKGDIFGPIRTGLGFSIVKLVDIRGRQSIEVEEVKASHILIKPSIILSDAKAQEMLQGFVDKINAGEADFAELAKKYSEGPTSVRGGDLGWSEPSKYDPAFSAALASLDIGEIHKPFRSSFGWHIAVLTGRRTIDATNQMNENRAFQILYNRKFNNENERWIKELRDEAFIEVKTSGKQ